MNILKSLTSSNGATIFVIACLLIIMIVVLIKILNINMLNILSTMGKKILSATAGFINKKEKRYHRDIEIGKLNEKRMRVKSYRFLNDLIIDLGLKRKGANPYEFLLLVIIASALISLAMCQIMFGRFFMNFIMFPIIFAGVMCGLYTRANISHDSRIEAIIESENIISNNIKDGVVVAVRNSIDVMPMLVRTEFEDFLDNVTLKNYHIRTALLELNNNLGSTADDFIKKCIVFEMEEEHGIVGMFADIVEINNIKTEMRIEMKHQFEEVSTEFIIGAAMIFVFLGGIMATFKVVANMYLHTLVGQLVLAIDFLIIIGEFVYLTYLRACEL